MSFTLEIPPRTLNPTIVTVTETSLPPPAGFTDYSPVYRIDPPSVTLQRPGRLRIPWSNRPGIVNRALSIYWSVHPDGPYEPIHDSYLNAGFSQSSLVRTGFAFVGYPAILDGHGCSLPPR